VKKEVKEQTKIAFTEITSTITNVDILPIVADIVAAYMDPVKLTEKALDRCAEPSTYGLAVVICSVRCCVGFGIVLVSVLS